MHCPRIRRMTAPLSLMALLLLVGCPSEAPAGGERDAGPPSAPTAGDTPAGEGGCATFVETLKATARAVMDRGLDVRLNMALATLETARQQAKGRLFDVSERGEDANLRVANQVCDRQHERLLEARAEAEAGAGEAADLGPSCTEARGILDGLVDRLDTEGLPQIGIQAIDTLRGARKGRENVEMACGMLLVELRRH
jgi:hypothetical protein